MTLTTSTATEPVVILYPQHRAVDADEWLLIQRLRQLRREGNGEMVLYDPRTKTLKIVSGRVEKLS